MLTQPSTRPLQIEPHTNQLCIYLMQIHHQHLTLKYQQHHFPGSEADHNSPPQKNSDQLCMDFYLQGFFFIWRDVVAVMLRKGVGLYYQDVYCPSGLATGGAGQGGQSSVTEIHGENLPNLDVI